MFAGKSQFKGSTMPLERLTKKMTRKGKRNEEKEREEKSVRIWRSR
jgi:hypothetical protein